MHGSKRFDGYGKCDATTEPLASGESINSSSSGSSSSSNSGSAVTNTTGTASTPTAGAGAGGSIPPRGFVPGDVMGCFLHLDEVNVLNNHVRYYRNGVDMGVAFCNVKGGSSTCFPHDPTVATGSGSCKSDLGAQLPSAVYYPAVSLYMKACVRVNFGPSFIIKPTSLHGAMAMSEVQPMSPLARKVRLSQLLLIGYVCSYITYLDVC